MGAPTYSATHPDGLDPALAGALAAALRGLKFGDEAFPTFADPAKSARKAREWAVGLNWYPERRIKIAVNYGQTSFEGRAAAGGDREDEKALLTRFQVAF